MAPSTSNALAADSVLSYISKSIPSTDGNGPVIKNPYAAIAIFTHACMLAVGFKLIGLGEDDKIEAHSESDDIQRLPTHWDQHSGYAFRYSHPQSSMEYMIKVTRLGGKAIIFGIGLGDDKTAQVEIKAQDYVSENSLKDVTSVTDSTDNLKNAFISAGRITDLSSLLKLNIIQKLAPGLRKEGYEDSTEASAQPEASRPTRQPREEEDRPPARDPLRDDQPRPARPYPFDDPLADAPRRPRPAPDFAPPGFEDEHELQNPRMGYPGGPRLPFGNIGEQDLYPPGLGPHDPLRMGPGGFRGGGGGMHPTFDDPLFQGQGRQGGYNPMAPPGARYDPIGPGDGPPNLRGGPRFPGGGGGMGGMGGRPPNPFGGFGSGDFI